MRSYTVNVSLRRPDVALLQKKRRDSDASHVRHRRDVDDADVEGLNELDVLEIGDRARDRGRDIPAEVPERLHVGHVEERGLGEELEAELARDLAVQPVEVPERLCANRTVREAARHGARTRAAGSRRRRGLG